MGRTLKEALERTERVRERLCGLSASRLLEMPVRTFAAALRLASGETVTPAELDAIVDHFVSKGRGDLIGEDD